METGEVMDQSIMNVVDINPIQILLTSLLEFKLERHSRNISSILKGYVMSSVPIAPFSGLPRCLLFQRKKDCVPIDMLAYPASSWKRGLS